MKSRFIKIVFNIFLIFFFINFVYSSVEVFSTYNTVLKINSDNTIVVNKTLVLKNIYTVGIVPGQIEFKVGKGTEGSIGKLNISDVGAYDSFGTKIRTQLRNTGDYSVIILDIYYPLLPGFDYKFNLNYKVSYNPGGIFFKSLEIPLRESTIPIESGKFKVILPKNYHFTYLSSEGKNATVVKNTAVWDIKNNLPKSVIFEYSYIPIRLWHLKGSYVFWIMVNLLLMFVLVFEVRKEIRRLRSERQK